MKTYYYKFNKFDACFFAGLLVFGIAVTYPSCITYVVFVSAAILWGYKHVLKQKAVVITQNDIKIDHSSPIKWKDIKGAEIKTVYLCGKPKKILSLIPKENIAYRYNYLQKHNYTFGPFPIPLYGILSDADEQAIIQEVQKYVKIKTV